ncbi:NAD kinase, partial [Frankliniella fusca]
QSVDETPHSPDEENFNYSKPIVKSIEFQTPEELRQAPVELTLLENVSILPQHGSSVDFRSTVPIVTDNSITVNRQGQNVRKTLFPPLPYLDSADVCDAETGPEVATDPPVAAQFALEQETLHVTADDLVEQLEPLSNAEVICEPVPQNVNNEPVALQRNHRKRKSEASEKTPPKKRSLNPSNWKKSQAKLALNSGLAHTNAEGKYIKGGELKPACPVTCRKKCFLKISHENRMGLFKKYYGLQSKTLQWNMINKLVRTLPVKRRRAVNEDREKPYRNHSYHYSLTMPTGENISVCQTMFLNTFDISITVVKTAVNKNSPDKRGLNMAAKKRMAPEMIQNVKNHIKEFPTVESHYCREDSRRKYLDENLSTAKMHQLYIMQRGALPNTATLRQYRDIFNTCFNLSFFKPKKDQCADCVQWERSSPEEKEAFAQTHEEHVENKNTARQLKKSDKEFSINQAEKQIRVITFDLQKVFYSPKSEVGEFFYNRKLSSYNFTIFDCTTGQAHCFVWDQTTAQRGSNEIASCVMMFMEEAVRNGITEFRIYSDSCSGQNKNKFLYSMYYLAARKYNIKIIHRYLEKGHTQMECDSVHAQIEKKTRNTEIFTPAQWYGYIKSAKVQKPAYIVKEIDQTAIFSFKDVAQHLSWANVPVSKIREIIIDSLNPELVSYKLQFKNESTTAIILQQKRGRPVNWSTLQLRPAYTGPLPLKLKLVNDLKWYVKKDLIPAPFLPFYNKLTTENVSQSTDDEDDVPQEIENHPQIFENDEEDPDDFDL